MVGSTLLALSLFLASAYAQKPAYFSPVLLEPGNDAGQCFTPASGSSGATVSLQPCTGASAQKWTFSGGAVSLFGGSKCLTTTDGTMLQIANCAQGNPNQQFSYSRDDRLSWTNHNKCVDLPGGSLATGTRAQLSPCTRGNPNQVWNTGYYIESLPAKSEPGQSGTNQCGTGSSQTSQCQTAWLNDADDFCLWAPPHRGTIGDTERIEVAWCTRSGRGTRTIPDGTLSGVHFVKTPDYVQVTGVGDLTKINVPRRDEGGELDPHGADGNGNPIGGLVYGNTFGRALQYHEWTSFISDTEYCFRACTGPNAARNCQHIYDLQGCYWNMPASYKAGVFESCEGQDDEPMGVYGTSTWHQGVKPTPPPHNPAPSSNCRTLPTVSVQPTKKRRDIETSFMGMPTPAPELIGS